MVFVQFNGGCLFPAFVALFIVSSNNNTFKAKSLNDLEHEFEHIWRNIGVNKRKHS